MDEREEGQALYEMALVLFLLLIVFLGIVHFGPRVYIRLAVDTAAYDCAIASVNTLDPGRGGQQGHFAADSTLRGFRLDPSRTHAQITGTWERSSPVTCRVTYQHGASFLPFMDILFPGASSTTSAEVRLPVATFKSRW